MGEVLDRLKAALADRYAIEREIGAGGMATVYLARDVRHNRKVALKVLRPELAALVGADRFLAEIETTANLQHPHILPLFDSGQADGFLFYVMPYVEGESLRERLDRERQLPVAEAVRIATAVAHALEHAHRHQVIHRDIKPANILLQDGEPVVADFGIALAVGTAGGGRLTETGLSLGTPYYMSPEQATGDQPVGPQTDVYALGCVLYESLVGEPPYPGSTAQAVLGKIIAGAGVSPRAQRPSIPANVDATIRRALEKLPADRFASGQEFAKALSDGSFRHGEDDRQLMGARGRRAQLAITGGAVVALALGVALGTALASPGPPPVTRFVIAPSGEQGVYQGNSGVSIAWSPDGTRIAWAGVSVPPQIWQRAMEQVAPQALAGSEGGVNPAYSPDGSSLAFTSGGSLKTISLVGGPSLTIVEDEVTSNGIDWGPGGSDGFIYFTRAGGPLQRVSATGGEVETLTTPESGISHRWVDALPDGDGVVFTVFHVAIGTTASEIAAMPSRGGPVRVLFPGAMARYSPSGHLIYVTADHTLMAVPFDAKSMETTGDPVALLEGVNVLPGSQGQFAISEQGTLAYLGAPSTLASRLMRLDRAGKAEPIDPDWVAPVASLSLSPDETRLAVSVVTSGPISADSPQDIWVKQLDRGPLSRLTFDDPVSVRPAWTQDGRTITYSSNRTIANSPAPGPFNLWATQADGTGTPRVLQDQNESVYAATWSADGSWLLSQVGASGARDVFAWRPGIDSLPSAVLATQADEYSPALSPDGRWLAYVSNETGRFEVYVRPFPNTQQGKWQVSTQGGSEPVWSRDGKELFYRNPAPELVSVSVGSSATFAAGASRVLFSTDGYLVGAFPVYAATRDGHFIMARLEEEQARPEITVVQNFVEVVKAAGR